MNTPIRLAIIGTAGRNDDADKLAARPAFYLERMLAAARAIANLTGATKLVSGGAAWADHIAVLLFLEDPARYSLELHLPAALRQVRGGELEYQTSTGSGKSNPGGTTNHWHREFSGQLSSVRPGWRSFQDLARVQNMPAVTIHVGKGFYDRDDQIAANSDNALAMTFGNGPLLKQGGTAHTMRVFLGNHSSSNAFHLDLTSLRLCRNAEAPARRQYA